MSHSSFSILMIGPHPDRVKGGVSSCVRNILSSDLVKEYPIDYMATKVDGSKAVKLVTALQAIVFFPWKLWRLKPALVHIQGSHYASFYRKMVFILLAKLSRKKVLFHCHGSRFDEFYQKGPFWQKILIKNILSLCDRVIVLSSYWKIFFSGFLEPSSLRVLENAIPLERYYSLKGRREKMAGSPIILFAGEVGERKGAYDLLNVIPDLIHQFPRLIIQLAGNGDLDKVTAVAESLEIQKHIQLLGWVSSDKMIALYYQADIFVLPSYHEGLPMAILEAMACGLPVVSTRVGGIPELVSGGENGILVDPGDRPALLASLTTLLADPALRDKMGQNNVQKVREEYDIPMYIKKLKNYYREILGEA